MNNLTATTTPALTPTPEVIEQIKDASERFQGLSIEVSKVIVGQREIVSFILNAILCDGHILLEGVPGVAKTTMIKAITNALGQTFNRIQFTPDLLPADLIGSLIYNPRTQEFETKKGPIFANLVLADEINRAPSKVQAALLEAMQERQVTIGSNTYLLDKPFLVFATQNPIEQEGTYSLPEAQVDRFLFKLIVGYPTLQDEREILKRSLDVHTILPILQKEHVFEAQKLVRSIYLDEKIVDYIVSIIFATRDPNAYGLKDIASYINYGVSPRATLALHIAAKAHAFLKKRHFVTPDDVKAIAPAVLRHRLLLTYQAEADHITTDHIIKQILGTIPSP
ncbi:MAG TPA: MoxR family ATPase [Candidatus Dependentiae bacterium]|nr:MoxR family ATPase [Candidatus Dependentiae bacterium]HRQ62994.1 MoxR family ATPase [Candidatus Dependentiae bacterium]